MEKVLLAVGHRQLEDYLEGSLSDEFQFVGATVYREGILRSIEQKGPDILVMTETLDGTENIMSILYNIRNEHPKVRIIFLAGNREVGDELLATLVSYGVYDILHGENIPAPKIVSLIRNKNSYNDIKHLQPIPVLDEGRNRVVFKAPIKYSDEEEPEDEEVEENDIEDGLDFEDEIEQVVKKKKKPKKKEVVTEYEAEDEYIVKEKKRRVINIQIPQINITTKPRDIALGTSKDNDKGVISERIVTFLGGKSGTGTTSIAINVAFALANKGKKVIYIEFDESYPAVSYWYDLGFIIEGIDTCIEALNKGKFDNINTAIVRSEDMRKTSLPMASNYKKFPKTIDFMFFSKEYLSRMKDKVDLTNAKELYLHLMYQLGYDFVIVDVPADMENQATINGLVYSNKIYSVITQDVASVGYSLFNINKLEKKGIYIKGKTKFVVNKYEQTNFKDKSLKDWIEIKSILKVGYYGADFTNANLKGLPVVLNSRNTALNNDIENIVKDILKK